MKIEEVLEEIYSMHQFSIKLGLENIQNLMKYLGNPEKKLKCIHIAGSNGKGSTASFIASILQEFGFKTGLYTSPHLVKFNERVRINGVMIDDEYIVRFFEKHHQYILDNIPTFFEITTALAFDYFATAGIDYAVIETGLGGRLDATNVINPLASVITSINYEHTSILGSTLSKIAFEKAGIIKENSKTFLGKLDKEAEDKIIEIAISRNNEVVSLANIVDEKENEISIEIDGLDLCVKDLPLAGAFQRRNAALAITTLYKTLKLKNKKIIELGLKNVLKNTGIEGRYEIYNSLPKVIFDAAHNEEGIFSFLNEFKKEADSYDNKILIFGAMRDKNITAMITALKPFFNEIIFTEVSYERVASIDELNEIALNLAINYKSTKNPEKVIDNFIKMKSNNCLVVLGSIYLLGKIKENLSS